jgi:hypothetical protein
MDKDLTLRSSAAVREGAQLVGIYAAHFGEDATEAVLPQCIFVSYIARGMA